PSPRLVSRAWSPSWLVASCDRQRVRLQKQPAPRSSPAPRPVVAPTRPHAGFPLWPRYGSPATPPRPQARPAALPCVPRYAPVPTPLPSACRPPPATHLQSSLPFHLLQLLSNSSPIAASAQLERCIPVRCLFTQQN